jgi:hypothetical protein
VKYQIRNSRDNEVKRENARTRRGSKTEEISEGNKEKRGIDIDREEKEKKGKERKKRKGSSRPQPYLGADNLAQRRRRYRKGQDLGNGILERSGLVQDRLHLLQNVQSTGLCLV